MKIHVPMAYFGDGREVYENAIFIGSNLKDQD
ncbi:hypothetical protein M2409_003842 [Sphingobacterium sp. JUb21]|nr:hypothetical protein [Sphingobacterium sp. JUb21]